MKSWLEKNNMEMYSKHNESKSVIAEIKSINTLFQFQKMSILMN